ncbi:MAG TPA: thioredoxin [Candidatus Anaerostipes excrementavium]|uniref:Thioredoxin n=1 Tax=Candidatus Anaerostipes excrementavium TaxID=2838463 RepID=A0A9D2BAB0_9FIRM|nr:thioredoxin [uncultured Anaerostipes sp.]HIX68024.1 thioredoxin [Candidatus Anaerostipes excrementavium]
MSVMHIHKDNFQEEVMNADRPVLLDFWASWCGPCQMLGPVIDQIADEQDEVKICKVNVDEQLELASQFGVMSIPTLVVMKEGKITNKSVGAKPKEQILAMLLV